MAKTVTVHQRAGGTETGYVYMYQGKGYPFGITPSKSTAERVVGGMFIHHSADEFYIAGVHEPNSLAEEYWEYDPTPIVTYTFEEE